MKDIGCETSKMVVIGEKFELWKFESRWVFCKGLTKNSDGVWKFVGIIESSKKKGCIKESLL